MDHAAQNIYPVLRYRDAHAAIDFICEAFGFERHAVYESDDGAVEHAQLAHGSGMVMVSTERDEDDHGWGKHAGQGWLYVVVEDADAHFQRAKAAGADDHPRVGGPGLRLARLLRAGPGGQPLELRHLRPRHGAGRDRGRGIRRLVSALKGASLALRFLLELCALAAVAYWGSRVSSSTALNVVVAVAAPLAVATVWGLWLAPNAGKRLHPPARTLLELAVLAVAVAALLAADEPLLGLILAVVAVANGLLLHIWQLDEKPAV